MGSLVQSFHLPNFAVRHGDSEWRVGGWWSGSRAGLGPGDVLG